MITHCWTIGSFVSALLKALISLHCGEVEYQVRNALIFTISIHHWGRTQMKIANLFLEWNKMVTVALCACIWHFFARWKLLPNPAWVLWRGELGNTRKQCKMDTCKTLLCLLSCYTISRSSALHLFCLPIKWKYACSIYNSNMWSQLIAFYCFHPLQDVRSELTKRFPCSKLFWSIPEVAFLHQTCIFQKERTCSGSACHLQWLAYRKQLSTWSIFMKWRPNDIRKWFLIKL